MLKTVVLSNIFVETVIIFLRFLKNEKIIYLKEKSLM